MTSLAAPCVGNQTKINSKKKAESGKRSQEKIKDLENIKVENMHTKIIHESVMYSMQTKLKFGGLRCVLNYQKNKKTYITERVVKIFSPVC